MQQMVSAGRGLTTRPILAAAGIAGMVVAGMVAAGTLALWVHYGSAVFFETIAAGFRSCF